MRVGDSLTLRARLSNFRQSVRKFAFVAILGISIGVLLWVISYRRNSSIYVATRATEALASRDVETLLRLTSPAELSALNLNNSNVTEFLTQTAYGKFRPKIVKVRDMQTGRPDETSYLLGLDRRCPVKNSQVMKIEEVKGEGWKLDLGHLLYMAGRIHCPKNDILENNHEATRLMQKFGIKGIRTNRDGYTYIQDDGKFGPPVFNH